MITRQKFIALSGFSALPELDKVCHLAWFDHVTTGKDEFEVGAIAKELPALGYAAPNLSRLKQRLRNCHNTLKGGNRGFKLRREYIDELLKKFPEVTSRTQEIVEAGSVLPEIDYGSAPGYITSLARQVNVTYESNAFDGCAVLMRRLVEVLLILAYRKANIDNVIVDSNGNYLMLEAIVRNASGNSTLRLSRTTKTDLALFRDLGNFSAHRLEYICRREYIEPVIMRYRAMVVELLYKAGLRN